MLQEHERESRSKYDKKQNIRNITEVTVVKHMNLISGKNLCRKYVNKTNKANRIYVIINHSALVL